MTVDFHVHTYHSYDSVMRPATIIRVAKERGLNGCVICDHNTIKGGVEAQKINTDKDFRIIVGAEIATNAGDVTGLFLKEEIRSRDVDEVMREIKEQGGIILLNHPYKGHDLSKIDVSKVDFIEGYNSRCSNEVNEKAVQLARQYNKPVVAGSDAHLYAEIANCKTYVENLETLMPVKTEFSPSSRLNITKSQYIKAWKLRSLKILFSATVIQAKHTLKHLGQSVAGKGGR
jgi:predicted metal-dependent phosphoesterase TrpH